jgi:hypothetical protein
MTTSNTLYRLLLKTPAGVKIYDSTSFEYAAYTNEINATGALKFSIRGNPAFLSQFVHRSQVEVWRANPSRDMAWYRDFSGIYIAQRREFDGSDLFTATAAGDNWLLGTRYIAYAAGVSNRTVFINQPVETIMKTLVTYNVTAAASVANGRDRAGQITGVLVEADAARGNHVDWYCARDNLLESLTQLARNCGDDFALVKTGAAAWEFRYYPGQLGTDRTASVFFSLNRGNMGQPAWDYDRSPEKTAAIVAGQDQGTNREIAIVLSPTYAADNDVEMFVDARNVATTDGLIAKGTESLTKTTQKSQVFRFDTIQTANSYYGLHYFLGDKVTAVRWFDDTPITQKIWGVTVEMSKQTEKIRVEMANV